MQNAKNNRLLSDFGYSWLFFDLKNWKKNYGQWEIAVRSLECHRRFQHEAHHNFSWLVDMNDLSRKLYPIAILYFFVSMLKSIAQIISIALLGQCSKIYQKSRIFEAFSDENTVFKIVNFKSRQLRAFKIFRSFKEEKHPSGSRI